MQAKFYLANLDATHEFGRCIGQIIQPQTVIALYGQMGSGKTTLTQAIAAGLQVDDIVVSPTFVMINEYHSGRLPLYHLDLYRFLDQPGQPIDFLMSQLEEILKTKGIVIIEWAQILVEQLGLDLNNLCETGYLSLNLQVDPDHDQARMITLKAMSKKDQSPHLLFSKLCELSKNFLRK